MQNYFIRKIIVSKETLRIRKGLFFIADRQEGEKTNDFSIKRWNKI